MKLVALVSSRCQPFVCGASTEVEKSLRRVHNILQLQSQIADGSVDQQWARLTFLCVVLDFFCCFDGGTVLAIEVDEDK